MLYAGPGKLEQFKTLMKKIIYLLLPVLVLLIFIGSCKKDTKSSDPKKNNTTKFYVRFKINGVAKELNYNPTTLFTSPLPIYAGELVGQFADNHANGVTIVLNDSTVYKTGETYTGQIITIKGKTTIQGTITFKDEDGTIYYASGTTSSTSLNLQFTELAADHVTGTFTAHLVKVGSSPLTYADITDGQFNLSRSL